MKCVVCRNGEMKAGTATVTLERDGMTLVVRGVPAQVCENCGEEYVEEAETTRLLDSAEEAARAGVKVDVRDYVAA
ncbi:MAG: type II toxin-antitoxin system MqsA family antitoxin [Alphaproteobacteria bacterium]